MGVWILEGSTVLLLSERAKWTLMWYQLKIQIYYIYDVSMRTSE